MAGISPVLNLREELDPEMDGEFVTYWSDEDDYSFPGYHVSDDPGANRDIDCIPLVELVNAIGARYRSTDLWRRTRRRWP